MTDIAIAMEGAWRRARRFDRIWLVICAVILGLAVTVPDQAVESLRFVISNLWYLLPFLAASVAIAAYATASGADSLIAKIFQARPAVMIAAAAAFGGLSPFCSCGVVPLIAALLAMGVPLPAVMAFWLSSPVTDPAMFILTAGALGMEFAVVKSIAAVALGLFGGYATALALGVGAFRNPLKVTAIAGGSGTGSSCGTSACSSGSSQVRSDTHWAFWRLPDRRAAFLGEVGRSTLFFAKWLTLAFLLESLMVVYLPAATVSQWLGIGSIWAMPLSVTVGIPAYLNGYAALPVVAGLMEMGMSKGAALGFLTAGGITSIPAAVAVYALVRRGVFVWYMVLAIVGSMGVGYAYQFYGLL